MTYDAIVIGGGPAGCSAALRLARHGYDVLLLEKGTYPQHKLCGEFLSPEVQALCAALGVLDAMHAAGAHPIDRVRVTTAHDTAFASALPGTALGLSRYRFDRLLFEHACAAGVDGRTAMRVRTVEGSLAEGFTVTADGASFRGRVVLGAYGKRARLDRVLARPFLEEKSPLVAFKAHFAGEAPPGQIELHAFEGGYCGVARVERDRVNVCWIARAEALRDAGGTPASMIAGTLPANSALAARLDGLERVADSFLAIGQVSLVRKALFARDVCMIGDTAGMIGPLCGDGMAMALQSAALAVPAAADFLDGHATADAFRTRYTKAWRTAFGRRMRIGRWIHEGYTRPRVARFGVRLARRVPALGRWIIRHTRG